MNYYESDQQTEFRIRNEVLVEAVENMKKHPPDALLEFKNAHPEHKGTKGISCALIADFFGLGESTLKKLKSGVISNPVCYTVWQLWFRGGIDPLALLGIPHGKECNEKQCTSDMRVMQQQIDSRDRQIADLERQLEKEQSETTRLRNRVLRESKALTAATVALVIMIAVGIWLVYKLANPNQGVFRTN